MKKNYFGFFFFCLFLKICKPVWCRADSRECGSRPGNIRHIVSSQQETADWPWIASFGFYDDRKWKHECGATLVSERHFITAGHCVRESASNWLVKAGVNELNSEASERFALDLRIEEKVIHPQYNRAAYFDIAVIRTEPFDHNKNIRPVCLPEEYSFDPDKYKYYLMTIIGWGSTSTTGKTSPVLKQADVKVFPQSYCNSVHQPFMTITSVKNTIPMLFQDPLMCAGNILGREGSCKGDSGGPLLFLKTETVQNQKFFQVGIIQGSIGECGDRNIPGIYIRLDDPLILNFLYGQITGQVNYQIAQFNCSNDSPKMRYKGNIVNEQPWGNGTMFYKDGSIYQGEWVNGSRQGLGKFIFAPDDVNHHYRFEGSWEDDKISGFGTMIWKNGEKYEGYFKSGLRHGNGKLLYSNDSGLVSFDGSWVEDKMSGYGVLISKNGKKYEGEFVDNEKSGYGIFTWNTGQRYEGSFKHDKRHGNGTYFYAQPSDFQKSVGEYENDKPIGAFRIYAKNGDVYSVKFENSKFQLFHENGSQIFVNEESSTKVKKMGGGTTPIPETERQEETSDSSAEWMTNENQTEISASEKTSTDAGGINIIPEKESRDKSLDSTGGGLVLNETGDVSEEDSIIGQSTGKASIILIPQDGSQEDVSLDFTGGWVSNEVNGSGRLHLRNGYQYRGDLKNGLPHGSGSLYTPTGVLIKFGNWENGAFVG